MNGGIKREPGRCRLIGHACAAPAIILNIWVPLLEDVPQLAKVAMLTVALAAYLLASLFYSLSKGRRTGWLVLGFLGPIGILLILLGPNYTTAHRFAENRRRSDEAASLAGLPKKTE